MRQLEAYPQVILIQNVLKGEAEMNLFKTFLSNFLGQARTDGAFCDISEDERLQYLKKINSQGVDNVEMEATAIASLCYKAGYKCAIICVTLLDRLDGDQVEISPDTYKKYVSRPIDLVAEYIKNYLREAEIEADLKPTAV